MVALRLLKPLCEHPTDFHRGSPLAESMVFDLLQAMGKGRISYKLFLCALLTSKLWGWRWGAWGGQESSHLQELSFSLLKQGRVSLSWVASSGLCYQQCWGCHGYAKHITHTNCIPGGFTEVRGQRNKLLQWHCSPGLRRELKAILASDSALGLGSSCPASLSRTFLSVKWKLIFFPLNRRKGFW